MNNRTAIRHLFESATPQRIRIVIERVDGFKYGRAKLYMPGTTESFKTVPVNESADLDDLARLYHGALLEVNDFATNFEPHLGEEQSDPNWIKQGYEYWKKQMLEKPWDHCCLWNCSWFQQWAEKLGILKGAGA